MNYIPKVFCPTFGVQFIYSGQDCMNRHLHHKRAFLFVVELAYSFIRFKTEVTFPFTNECPELTSAKFFQTAGFNHGCVKLLFGKINANKIFFIFLSITFLLN